MKILVVDDQLSVIEAVKEVAEKLGSEVISFTSFGEIEDSKLEFERFCEENECDVVLLDYHLTEDLKGDAFVQTLKKFEIPFVAFSGDQSFNRIFKKAGAIHEICKDDLYDGDGLNKSLLVEKLSQLEKLCFSMKK